MIAWDKTRLVPPLAGYVFIAVFGIGLLADSRGYSNMLSWALLASALACLAVARPASLGEDMRKWPHYWAVVIGTALYFGALLATTAFSEFSGERSWFRHFYASVLALAAVASMGIILRSRPDFPRLLSRWLMAAFALGAIVLLGAHALQGTLGQDRLSGIVSLHWFLNPNAVGAVYGIGFAIAVGHLLGKGVSRTEMLLAVIAALLTLTVVLLTQSRSSMLGCGAALAVAVFALSARMAIAAAGAILLATVAITITFSDHALDLLQRGDSLRFPLWQDYLAIAMERPFFGYGLQYDVTYVMDRGTTIYTPHNQFLGAFVRGGLLGLFLLGATLAAAIWAVAGAAKRGWWLPAVVLAACLAMTSFDHEPVPATFGYYWYVFWLPLSFAAASGIHVGVPNYQTWSEKTATT